MGGGVVRKAGVMLEDVVASEVIKREPSGVGLWVGGNGKLKQELGCALVKVDSVEESVDQLFLGNVLAAAR